MEQGNKKSFNEIYEEIYKASKEEVTALKKEKNTGIKISILLLILAVFVLAVIKSYIITGIVIIIAVLCQIKSIDNSIKYNRKYKELVITKLVSLYNPNLTFLPKDGVTEPEYKASNFTTERYDYFNVEDLIQGTVGNEDIPLKMSQVRITKTETDYDSDGNARTTTVTLFSGLFGMTSVPKTKIGSVHLLMNNNLAKTHANRIEVDSAEFEKYYDLMADNKVLAMQVFTSEVVELLNRFKESTKHVMEIKINSMGKLYFRIHCGDVFEAPSFKDALDMETIHKYYKMIVLPIQIINMIYENMKNLE